MYEREHKLCDIEMYDIAFRVISAPGHTRQSDRPKHALPGSPAPVSLWLRRRPGRIASTNAGGYERFQYLIDPCLITRAAGPEVTHNIGVQANIDRRLRLDRAKNHRIQPTVRGSLVRMPVAIPCPVPVAITGHSQ